MDLITVVSIVVIGTGVLVFLKGLNRCIFKSKGKMNIEQKIIKYAFYGAVIVVIFWLASWGLIWIFVDGNKRGQFGDMFGAVNSLFSGLAFLGLLLAIILQYHELKDTRKELKGQKNALEKQNETLELQKFENTFFQMLQLHNEILKGIEIQKTRHITPAQLVDRNPLPPPVILSGRKAIGYIIDLFKGHWKSQYENLELTDESMALNSIYSNFFNEKCQHLIGHYFRNLYNIIKLADRSSIQDKKTYTNLVRAQLSTNELTLLFYNCWSDLGKEKFKPLIIKYKLLKTLNKEDLCMPDEHYGLYESSLLV
jgi:hypothetical protein